MDVRVEFSKWGGQPHWEFDAVRLGDDQHGTWLGAPAGTRLTRPGVEFCAELSFVVLIPAAGAFAATFYEWCEPLPHGWVDTYVDITSPPVWDGSTVRMVDLDLDVVKGRTGRIWVDDEDEFADHRVRFGYPEDVVDLAVRSCAAVRDAVESAGAPYDGATHTHWLGMLRAAMMER